MPWRWGRSCRQSTTNRNAINLYDPRNERSRRLPGSRGCRAGGCKTPRLFFRCNQAFDRRQRLSHRGKDSWLLHDRRSHEVLGTSRRVLGWDVGAAPRSRLFPDTRCGIRARRRTVPGSVIDGTGIRGDSGWFLSHRGWIGPSWDSQGGGNRVRKRDHRRQIRSDCKCRARRRPEGALRPWRTGSFRRVPSSELKHVGQASGLSSSKPEACPTQAAATRNEYMPQSPYVPFSDSVEKEHPGEAATFSGITAALPSAYLGDCERPVQACAPVCSCKKPLPVKGADDGPE